MPIVHCSVAFLTLTGYEKDEIIGRNCRFLQNPHQCSTLSPRDLARVELENRQARQRLKAQIERGEEAQDTLINFTKTGEYFINLLTVIPIIWEDQDQENGTRDRRLFIGFQADKQKSWFGMK